MKNTKDILVLGIVAFICSTLLYLVTKVVQ